MPSFVTFSGERAGSPVYALCTQMRRRPPLADFDPPAGYSRMKLRYRLAASPCSKVLAGVAPPTSSRRYQSLSVLLVMD
jgi:hypothetical protein